MAGHFRNTCLNKIITPNKNVQVHLNKMIHARGKNGKDECLAYAHARRKLLLRWNRRSLFSSVVYAVLDAWLIPTPVQFCNGNLGLYSSSLLKP